MPSREWRGHWWLPEKSNEAIPGILVQDEDGSVFLRLIGGFSNVKLRPVKETDSSTTYEPEFVDTFPVILGRSAGELFTLLQCAPIQSGGGRQDVRVLRALRGIHLSEPDQALFDGVTLKIEYLLGWMRSTAMTQSIEWDNQKWTGRQEAKTAPVEDLAAHHAGYDYVLGINYNAFSIESRSRANERSIVNGESAELTVRAPQPTDFSKFDHIAKEVMDLMTLAAHQPAGVIEETLLIFSGDTVPGINERRPNRIEVLGRHIHQPKPGKRETADAEYLFTLDDVSFADILPRWLDLHERTWLPCSTMFGLRYIPQGYVTARLLAVATAAEAMHRELNPEAKRLPLKKFEDLRARVMDAFKGKDPANKEIRAFLNDGLHNEMYFKDRLIALSQMPDQEAVKILIKNVSGWAKYVKDQRNGIAHADRERIGADEGGLAFDAMEVTYALLGLVLLNELGLSGEVQRRAASSQYISLMVERFNKTLG